MASVVAKHPGCGGNGIPAMKAPDDRRKRCLRCGALFTVPTAETRPVDAGELAELVAGSTRIGYDEIACGYEPRSIGDSWTQEYEAIVRVTDAAVLFRLEKDREAWVPKSVLIAVGSRSFECATWFARKEIDV